MIAALYVLAQAMPLDPGRHSILRPGAPQGSHIEWLYWVIFWIVFAVYVLMILGFTRAGTKSRSDAIYPLPVFEDKEGDERAKWAALATDDRGHGMELRAFYGNVLFSTGPNQQFGGPNRTQCHLDIPMRNCSLYLDERPIIVDGEVVVDEMKPAGAPVPV